MVTAADMEAVVAAMGATAVTAAAVP